MLESYLRGYYTPSFYKLVVNTAYDLTDLTELEKYPEPFSTFSHEYLHFLQDITTTFGLMNGTFILNEIKYFNHHVLSCNTTFETPIPLNKNSHMELSRKMKTVYMGPVQRINSEKVCYVKRVASDVRIPEPYNTDLYKVIIGLECSDNSIKEVDFGGLSLIESMAHIAQKHYYPDVEHDAIPYKSALLVAKYLHPKFVQNELYVFALCDACLMTTHPGLTFMDFLTGLKKDNIVPTNEEQVYQLVYSKITGNGKNIIDLFKEISETAQSMYLDYFTTDLHENEKLWITELLRRSRTLRLQEPSFMLNLLKQEKANSAYFHQVIVELGSPLIENLVGESHIFVPRDFENTSVRIDVFSAINEIFKLYDSGKKSCGLIEYCKNSEKGNITDERCENAPWERVNDQDLCNFAIFWKMWGLQDIKPI